MPLTPAVAERLHLLEGISEADLARGADPETARRLSAFYADEPWTVPAGVAVSDFAVPGPHGDVPLRRYDPTVPSGAFVLWAHGGGFLAGSLDWPESHTVSAELAFRSGATVLAVDYRLAGGDVRYPIPIDDVSAALAWMGEEARRTHEKATIVIGGASAGAALALSAALRTPEATDALLLAYPFAHFPVPALDPDTQSVVDTLPPLLRFLPQSIENMVKNYVGRVHNLPADALPGHAVLTDALPPTSVLLSEFDDLRPSGELLARQLTDADVMVRTRVEPGTLHGHLNRLPSLPGVNESLDWLVEGVRLAGSAPRLRTKPAEE